MGAGLPKNKNFQKYHSAKSSLSHIHIPSLVPWPTNWSIWVPADRPIVISAYHSIRPVKHPIVKGVIVTKICKTCGQVIDIEVNKIDYDRYKAGLIKVQDAFPYLTADEREMLITGIVMTRCLHVRRKNDMRFRVTIIEKLVHDRVIEADNIATALSIAEKEYNDGNICGSIDDVEVIASVIVDNLKFSKKIQ